MSLAKKTKVSCYMSLVKRNKSVMLHSFGRKTKVSCYMALEEKSVISCMALEEKEKRGVTWVWEKKSVISCMGLEGKEKCLVTWVWKKNKSVMLHGFRRQTEGSCYMVLEEKQVSCYMVMERVEHIGCVIGCG